MTTRGGESAAQRWSAAGLRALSGPRERAGVGPPHGLVEGVDALGARIRAASAEVGTRVDLDWLALLGERAALEGLSRGGALSCGGATALLPTIDSWIAISLARPSDVEALPAWLGADPVPWPPGPDAWSQVRAATGLQRTARLVEQGRLLGLAVGGLGERAATADRGVVLTGCDGPGRLVHRSPLRVLDLTALWAGPLCASLLGLAGADVVKVESTTRPDGSRVGSPGLFRLLNAGSRSVALDLTTAGGRATLADLIRRVDVVVESSRPRALEQMGVVAAEAVAARDGPRVWVSITGHGRAANRVALGDDAAVAGGLVVEADGRPWFCADAVADPISGLAAAAATLEALAGEEAVLIEVAMAGVAASMAGATLSTEAGADVPAPRARPTDGASRLLGADTDEVLATW